MLSTSLQQLLGSHQQAPHAAHHTGPFHTSISQSWSSLKDGSHPNATGQHKGWMSHKLGTPLLTTTCPVHAFLLPDLVETHGCLETSSRCCSVPFFSRRPGDTSMGDFQMCTQPKRWSVAETARCQNPHKDSDLWNLGLLADVLKDAIE